MTTDTYYSAQWQPIETRQGTTVTTQNVFGIAYVNDLVFRDDNSASGNLGKSGSGLGRRLYAQHDANWNVTAITNFGGMVVERFVYNPYGTAVVLNAAGTSTTIDSFGWTMLYQGGNLDKVTGLYVYQRRDYVPTLGRWSEADPANYTDGLNRFEFDMSTVINGTDPEGLWTVVRSSSRDEGTATSAQGDTIRTLAATVRLDDKDFRIWARIAGHTRYAATGTEYNIDTDHGTRIIQDLSPDDVICPGQRIMVPNIAFIDITAWSWGILKQWNKRKVDWAKQYFAQSNYRVVYTDNATRNDVLGHLRSNRIYAYFYIGHGQDNGNLTTADDGTIAAAKNTPYGISEMFILSCWSWTGRSGWGQNVSLDGNLQTYEGKITAYSGTQHNDLGRNFHN